MSSDRAEMKILAFDLALITGWALCRIVRGHEYGLAEQPLFTRVQVVESGVIDAHIHREPSPLTEETYVKRLFKFGRALDATILGQLEYIHRAEQITPVDIVAYELASWRAKKGTSGKVREMALRLSGVLLEHLWYAESIGVEVTRVAPQEWQRFVFGDKYKAKQPSAERKKLSMDHCRSLGYKPANHHIADAVNIAYFVVRKKLDA